ncbi:hypothetical protein EC973_007755 [Apophysomyces ossiformis]|uniref:Uncharacterized protein n=1 Tax=Apophysomyces ossiformis TaxID=679940 RepID=A0A8H7ETE1_9FUNG|nr:hypothetical protein EC973_007755 [Apophysomyces ossiformis]
MDSQTPTSYEEKTPQSSESTSATHQESSSSVSSKDISSTSSSGSPSTDASSSSSSSKDSTTTTTTTSPSTTTIDSPTSSITTESKTTAEPTTTESPPSPPTSSSPPPTTTTEAKPIPTAATTENEPKPQTTSNQNRPTDHSPSTTTTPTSTTTAAPIPNSPSTQIVSQTQQAPQGTLSGQATWNPATLSPNTISGLGATSNTVTSPPVSTPSVVFGQDACAADPVAVENRCPAGYFCATARRKCIALLENGASCNENHQCASGICQAAICMGNSHSISGNAVAGIVIGSIIGLVLLVLGFMWYNRRLQRRRMAQFVMFHNDESDSTGLAMTKKAEPSVPMTEKRKEGMDTSAYEDHEFYGDVALAALSNSSAAHQLRPTSYVSRSSTPDPYSSTADPQIALQPPPRASILPPGIRYMTPFDHNHLISENRYAQPADLDAFQISRQEQLCRQSLGPLAHGISGDAWSNEDRISLARPSHYSDISSGRTSTISAQIRR